MNKIVREHYPVEKLPEDLRELVPDAEYVTVEVTEELENSSWQSPSSVEEAMEMMRATQRHVAARGESVTEEEAVRRIRKLRDEWDD